MLFFTDTPFDKTLLHYQRHDMMIDAEWLALEASEMLTGREVERLSRWDRADMVDKLLDLARVVAGRQVQRTHLTNTDTPSRPA